MTRAELVVPRWAPVTTMALAGAGAALSAYLTVEHLTDPGTLACPATGTVDCGRVTTSEYAQLFGVPVAVLGLGFFVAMLAVCLPAAWRIDGGPLRWGRVVLAGTGVVFVIYLVYAELFLVDAICLWCTAVHVVALALFAAVVMATALTERSSPPGAGRDGRRSAGITPRSR